MRTGNPAGSTPGALEALAVTEMTYRRTAVRLLAPVFEAVLGVATRSPRPIPAIVRVLATFEVLDDRLLDRIGAAVARRADPESALALGAAGEPGRDRLLEIMNEWPHRGMLQAGFHGLREAPPPLDRTTLEAGLTLLGHGHMAPVAVALESDAEGTHPGAPARGFRRCRTGPAGSACR